MPNPPYTPDTIVAQATAPGRGAIGIVRLSGPATQAITQAIAGALPPPRVATLAKFTDASQQLIDEGLTLYFPAPNSFTGEDVAEFHCHGGPVVLSLLTQRALDLGARQATPGEFSQRAFLNNKLDLAQAEAIADLIAATSAGAARSAVRSLQGDFSVKVNALVAELTRLRVLVEAAIDFPEEETETLEASRIAASLASLQRDLAALLRDASQGALLNEGAAVALAGKPNAGKSSLMNRLTGADTSIVTEVPGTTRDLIRAQALLDDLPINLVDTAGLRSAAKASKVEAEGIARASRAIKEADLAILLVDAALPLATRKRQLADLQAEANGVKAILALNKTDLVKDFKALAKGEFAQALPISCKTGQGIPQLKRALGKALGQDLAATSTFSARRRHLAALQSAAESLAAATRLATNKPESELLAEELRQAQNHLTAITGAISADDLLGEIFSSFCIGK